MDTRTPLLVLSVAVTVLLAACASGPPSVAPAAASSATASAAPSATPTPEPTLSPTPTPIPTIEPGARAIAGLETWLRSPAQVIYAQVSGTRVGVPLHGVIRVQGPDSYQLIGAESGRLFAYERTAIGGTRTRSIGMSYKPGTTSLTVAERFGEALAASSGWQDLGAVERDGATLRHLRAGTSGLTDGGLIIDVVPADAPTELRQPGTLDAYVLASGLPQSFEYTSDAYVLRFRLLAEVPGPISDEAVPLARHASKTYGYAFGVPPSMTFDGIPNGEQSGPGKIIVRTYCVAKPKGGLDTWATDGIRFYTRDWGDPDSVLETGVARGTASATPLVLSTWTDRSDPAAPVTMVNAAFLSGKYACDLQSWVDPAYADEAMARFDRLLLTLTVAR